ncbi:glycosyltransferase [Actinophytocola gossypii]|uniref:Glycosyltransferase family 2 protein n=1 Tax=Actinophytocola gossypii TaxID=2812003 RepID=A0ABT2J884_9PSEU|nr:glycosyltransferase [Actinophytocola gossypii]MCT2583494.1 glycosyltransferase family 2 protein [Actinophytocola gossypii]
MTDPDVDVVIPTRNRPVELATTLAGLAAQTHERFRVLVSDQSDDGPSYDTPPARSLARVLTLGGRETRFVRHLPRLGLAEHRAYLLSESTAAYVLFLDDDVWLEPAALARMRAAIGTLGCGFVGAAVQGLSYVDDERPWQLEPYEEWLGPVRPERLTRGDHDRVSLHSAANPYHLERRLNLAPGEWRAYKVAWVGGCVLYDRAKLVECGGFDFWPDLPVDHAGEDVGAQWRVMARYGGAGVLPTGAIHLESPTTVPDRQVEVTEVIGEFAS